MHIVGQQIDEQIGWQSFCQVDNHVVSLLQCT